MQAKRSIPLETKIMLSRAEVSALTGLSVNFILQREQIGDMPSPVRVGRRVLYPREAIEAWARSGGMVGGVRC